MRVRSGSGLPYRRPGAGPPRPVARPEPDRHRSPASPIRRCARTFDVAPTGRRPLRSAPRPCCSDATPPRSIARSRSHWRALSSARIGDSTTETNSRASAHRARIASHANARTVAKRKKIARSASESAPTKFTLPKENFSSEKAARIAAATCGNEKTPANPGLRTRRRECAEKPRYSRLCAQSHSSRWHGFDDTCTSPARSISFERERLAGGRATWNGTVLAQRVRRTRASMVQSRYAVVGASCMGFQSSTSSLIRRPVTGAAARPCAHARTTPRLPRRPRRMGTGGCARSMPLRAGDAPRASR